MRKGRVSILFGGLTGIDSIALIQLLSVPELDLPLTIAIYCFSFALPLSAFFTLSAQEHLKANGTKVPFLYEAFAIVTLLAGFTGLDAIFFHIGIIPAIIFLTTSLLSLAALNTLHDNKNRYFSTPKKKRIKQSE